MNARQYLQTCKAEDILSGGAFHKYNGMMRGILPHLVALNTNLFLLSKIIEFPFEFLGIDPQPYWTATQHALFDGSVLALWRVVLDTNPACQTLAHVKNHLFASLRDGRAQMALSEIMKRCFPSGWANSWEARVEEIRHNYVAHFNFDKQMSPTKEDVKRRALSLENLKEAQEQVVDFFNILALGVRFLMLPMEYEPGVKIGEHTDQGNDIERLLESLARDSYLVNLPETKPMLLPLELKRMSEEDRDRLNAFRLRFGLSEV